MALCIPSVIDCVQNNTNAEELQSNCRVLRIGSRHTLCAGLNYPYRVVSRCGKRSPHYDLVRVQADVARLAAAAFTKTALDGGRCMGLTTAEMLAVIASLSRREFYK